jgi:hypothetical protein
MGKATKLLKIAYTDEALAPYLQQYAEQGHTVVFLDLGEADVAVGSKCHGMPPAILRDLGDKAIKLMIRRVRERKYPAKVKK